jgi:hypothetical protein
VGISLKNTQVEREHQQDEGDESDPQKQTAPRSNYTLLPYRDDRG